VEYHRKTLLEAEDHADRALALLSERTVVVGSRVGVRQVVDCYHGEGETARHQAGLVAALKKAPRAREGRPALLFAILPPQALRARLSEAGWGDFGADATYVAAALAV